jgi:hypothetical protein
MHTKTKISTPLANRVYSTREYSPSTPLHVPAEKPNLLSDEFLARSKKIVRNPLFLVVVTWLVMAGLLVVEIVAGQ